MLVLSPIKIDLRKQTLREAVYAVQNDSNTRGLELTLVEGESPWNIPVDTTAAISFRKPDGTSGLYDTLPDGVTKAVEIAQNKVTAIFAPQVLTCPGRVDVSLILFDSLMNRLGTFPIPVFVSEDPSAGQGISNDYYNFQTLAELNEAINNKASMEYTKKVGNPHNLLDNSDFRNPVNTSGVTSYTERGPTIDRWYISEDREINVLPNGVEISTSEIFGGMSQKVDKLVVGDVVTVAVQDADGNLHVLSTALSEDPNTWHDVGNGVSLRAISLNDVGIFTIAVTYDKKLLQWAALYEGEYTAETLPEYQPKGYNVELLNCGGYAPSGYGLGGNSKMLTSADNLDNFTADGWYTWSEVPQGVSFGACVMQVKNHTQHWLLQEVTNLTPYTNCKMVRSCLNKDWQPWEWENPPMVLGVEYRTTKRHNGKALYVIRVNVGALPNRASNGVPVTKTDGTNVTFAEIVEISGVAKSSGGNNPMGNQGGLSDVWITNESKMTVNMLTTDDLSSKTLEVTIWYTKD